MEPPRHRAFFVIRRLAGDPDPEPENPGNPHKQRKKQENRRDPGSPVMGARGRVWMHVCAGFASGECRRKTAGSGCFGGTMTLNVFVIFGGFDSQGVCNSLANCVQ